MTHSNLFEGKGPTLRMRTEQEILIDVAQLLVEVLAELKHIRAGLGSASRSSVEIAQNSKGVNLTVKAYEGSLVGDAGDAALEEFARLYREAEQRSMSGWRQTVDGK